MKTYVSKGMIAFYSMLLSSTLTQAGGNVPWKSLFNGKNFTGWEQKGGQAKYSVKNGEIVGTTVINTSNTFLCTKENFSNFILELEVLVDTSMNSGIQFRSHSKPDYQDGRVHGYQAEIDPSSRAWSGGIYDEGRRGWLYDLQDNQNAQKAFKNGKWNKYRIEAIGNHIRTWINDTPCADLWDNADSEGFIALQVHGISDNYKAWAKDAQVKWRNINIITTDVDKYKKPENLSIKEINLVSNTLTKREIAQGWKLLWDGKTTQGWKGAYIDKFPEKGWNIQDGILTVQSSEGKESANGGDIVTVDEYSNFELLVDFKLTEGANSGIKYFVTGNEGVHKGSAIGLEYQLLDDAKHPDAKLGRSEGIRTCAGLYDLIKPENKKVNPIGEWNHARIVVKGSHVEHWLNGSKTVEYERGSQEFRKLVSESKYKDYKNFGEAPKGHILLQDHGNQVYFRNIKIKILK
jgi:hypothetical protein